MIVDPAGIWLAAEIGHAGGFVGASWVTCSVRAPLEFSVADAFPPPMMRPLSVFVKPLNEPTVVGNHVESTAAVVAAGTP
ncbi:MAG: hypothetical protein JOY78_17645 [Pseudonocardia sp.]|nr:hypothetical protein [Pseudonocardia sp.]